MKLFYYDFRKKAKASPRAIFSRSGKTNLKGKPDFGGSKMQVMNPEEKAIFLKRPNRFTLLCQFKGKVVTAFLPNPGRLWELLLPGAVVYLEKTNSAEGKMPYTAVAIEKENHPVMVHTLRANALVQELIKRNLVPGLKGTRIIRREVPVGRSRFDFLLQKGEQGNHSGGKVLYPFWGKNGHVPRCRDGQGKEAYGRADFVG
jgi:hypothetical protein